MSDDERGGSATVSEQARRLCERHTLPHAEDCPSCRKIQQALDAARAEGAKAERDKLFTRMQVVTEVRAEERQRAARIVRENIPNAPMISCFAREAFARAIEADTE